MSVKTTTLNSKNFKEEVIDSEKPVLVDFWATWCQPCLMMEPVLEELANELQEDLKISKLNTETPDHQQIAFEYNIRSIPNMKLFKGGKVVDEFIGYRPKHVFLEELKEALSKI